MAKSQKPQNIIETITNEIITKLKVEATVTVSEETDEQFQVHLETDESGLIIGRHGETLNSLQLLIGVIVYKHTGAWRRIIVDVGDYRKAREESIKEMVRRIMTEVSESGQPATLPFLTPLERRIVHLVVSENERFLSESHGEGKDRRLTIQLKTV